MIIYLIKNRINGKVYIGQTIQPLRKRIDGHIADAKRNRATKIARSIRKYGSNNFTFGELIKCSNSEELNEMELYYINYYNCLDDKFGYNIRIGGECGSITSEETKKKISIGGMIAAKKAKENGGHWNAGKKCSEEKKKHLSRVLGNEFNPRNKPVYMYDKKGNFIKKFYNSGEAARYIAKSRENIASCCLNKLKSAYGYKWSYEYPQTITSS